MNHGSWIDFKKVLIISVVGWVNYTKITAMLLGNWQPIQYLFLKYLCNGKSLINNNMNQRNLHHNFNCLYKFSLTNTINFHLQIYITKTDIYSNYALGKCLYLFTRETFLKPPFKNRTIASSKTTNTENIHGNCEWKSFFVCALYTKT